ncbi:MAG TPA: enoyl-CoA hydratase/isomerase family protein [Solirubrobacterales bacterium]|nr:enoyl-CoA hydratase/isomerase family protein [Solirubrobacterales bacterium]
MDLAGGKLLLDEPAEAVARLTLNRPDLRNALDHELLDGLAAAMRSLDRGIEVRCVVLTGAGRAFSAGYDIAGIPSETFERDAEALVAHPFQAALDAIAAHPWPVIAAINGHALGGGLELTLTCDLRIAAHGAKLGMPPAKLGLIYGHTGLRRFIDAIGIPRTKELFLTGRNIPAERAERIGLVHEVVDDAVVERESLALAAEVAANAPLSMRGNKHAIDTLNSHPRLTPEQERELIELRESCFASEDFREGIAAFAEKRKPAWKGR